MHPVKRSNGFEELNGRVVTAHEKVLAVIDNRARGGIAKRTSPPAEVRLLFEQADPLARPSQRHTCRQTRETAADNDDLICHGWEKESEDLRLRDF
jgi:hypothetical protein